MREHSRYCYAAFCLLLLSGGAVAAATDDRGALLVEKMMTVGRYKAKVGDGNYREAFVRRCYEGWSAGFGHRNPEVVALTSCFLGAAPLTRFLRWYEKRCGCFTQGYWFPYCDGHFPLSQYRDAWLQVPPSLHIGEFFSCIKRWQRKGVDQKEREETRGWLRLAFPTLCSYAQTTPYEEGYIVTAEEEGVHYRKCTLCDEVAMFIAQRFYNHHKALKEAECAYVSFCSGVGELMQAVDYIYEPCDGEDVDRCIDYWVDCYIFEKREILRTFSGLTPYALNGLLVGTLPSRRRGTNLKPFQVAYLEKHLKQYARGPLLLAKSQELQAATRRDIAATLAYYRDGDSEAKAQYRKWAQELLGNIEGYKSWLAAEDAILLHPSHSMHGVLVEEILLVVNLLSMKAYLRESLRSEYRKFCKPEEMIGCWATLRSFRTQYRQQKAAVDGYTAQLSFSLQVLDSRTRASLVASLKPYAAYMAVVDVQADGQDDMLEECYQHVALWLYNRRMSLVINTQNGIGDPFAL